MAEAMTNVSLGIGSDEEFPLLMPKWGYVASAFVLFLIGFFGFFLNLMVILLMMKDRQLWTPLNMILFNLVCSDFCVSIMGNPLTLISALFHQWVFGKTMCMVYGFFMALLGISSITSLTVLSFERYLMVTRPLTTRQRTSGGTCIIIACIWIYSLLLTTPPLIGWGNYVNEAANISCSVNWHEQSTNTLTYILFLFAFGQVIPFAVITFSYFNIIRTIRRNSKRMGQVGRAETKVTVMVLVMIIAFAVAWTPYSVFALLEQFAVKGTISPGLGVIPALVAKSSICYDPLIYIGMNTQFRQSIRKLFSGKSKANSSHTEKVLLPTNKVTKTLPRQNSVDSIVSTITKKHVVVLDKKLSFTDVASIKKEESSSPLSTPKKLSKGRIERFGELTLKKDHGAGGLEFVCEVSNQASPELKMVDPERLLFRKGLNAFTNQGFELTIDTMNKDRMFGEKRWASSAMVHSCSSDLAGHGERHQQPREGSERNLTVETNVESSTERKYTRHYSLRNHRTEVTKKDDKKFIL